MVSARAPGLDRTARSQLGLPRGGQLRRATRLARDTRSRCPSGCAEGDRDARLVRPRSREGPCRRGGASPVALRGQANPRCAIAAHARAHRAERRPADLQRRLYEEHRVEIPFYEWEDTTVMRVSIGPYNDESDVARLADAVRDTLAQ